MDSSEHVQKTTESSLKLSKQIAATARKNAEPKRQHRYTLKQEGVVEGNDEVFSDEENE